MVNSGSFDSDGDRNAKAGITQSHKLSDSSQSSSPVTASAAAPCKIDYSQTADSDLPSAAFAIEPTPTKTEFNSSTTVENYTKNCFVGVESGAEKEKASVCCSLPLDKVQSILTTYHQHLTRINSDDSGDVKVKQQPLPRKLFCLYCERTFVSANLKQKHVERSHSAKQNRRVSSRRQNQLTVTPCIYCDKLNTSEHTLTDLFHHLVKEHSNKYYGCLPCEDRFLTPTLLADHNVSNHNCKDVKSEASAHAMLPKIEEIVVDSLKEVEEEVPVKITRSKMKPRAADDPLIIEENVRRKRHLRNNAMNKKKTAKLKEIRAKKLGVKSSKIALKRSKRLQAQAKEMESQKRKREKRLTNVSKSEQINSTKVTEKSKCNLSSINPYPEFDHFYRVKKITDHSIDNLKISSLTFDDVFDKAFFNRIKCNIEENLLHHIDGKLFKNEESENRISNFEKISNLPQETQNSNCENYGCEISLNAVTPVASLSLNSQFGEDFESQIEYGSKPSKKKTQSRKDEVHYKYFTRRKYQASILQQKENRDLSKLDMWTQLIIKNRQQKMLDDKKSAKEILEYTSGEEYKNKMRREELNRILDRRGPFEDLKEEATKKAALEKLNSSSENDISEESFSEIREVLNCILNKVFEITEDVDADASPPVIISKQNDKREIPSYLNLRRSSSLTSEGEVDKSDKITLICSSQETENFELPTNKARGKNEMVELTGEWARCRMYVCAACSAKLPNMKYLLEHKSLYHQNVWVQHYELVGNQSELYRHLSIPGLGKVGAVEDAVQCKLWKRSDARICTKCGKQCNALGELHRHILECGGDWTWMLARKKCKYRPFGAKSRRKRRGLVHRLHHKQKTEPTERKIYKKTFDVPRQRPSDADTIQRMLANLPAKRSRRNIISLQDVIFKSRRNKKNNKPNQINGGKKVRGQQLVDKVTSTKINMSNLKTQRNNIPASRKSLRSINKVLSSRILDTNATLMVKRKLKVLNERRITRQSRLKYANNSDENRGNKNKLKEKSHLELSKNKIAKKTNSNMVEAEDNGSSETENIIPEPTIKRVSPRSVCKNTKKKISVKKLLTGKMNIKNFFPVKKKKNMESDGNLKQKSISEPEISDITKTKRRSKFTSDVTENNLITTVQEEPKKGRFKNLLKTLTINKKKCKNTESDHNMSKISEVVESINQVVTKNQVPDLLENVSERENETNTTTKKKRQTKDLQDSVKISVSKNRQIDEARNEGKCIKKNSLKSSNNKRKLKRSFRSVINKVKKLKIDNVIPENVQQDFTPVVAKNNSLCQQNIFLETENAEKEKLPPIEKIVIPLEAKEKSLDLTVTAPVAINYSDSKENPPIPETIFNLESNNEKSLQAKGELDFDKQPNSLITVLSGELPQITEKLGMGAHMNDKTSPLCIETSEKPKIVPLISPNMKGKIRKPNRGLNDCIAMLTSKLQHNEEQPLSSIDSIFKIVPSAKSTADPINATKKSECILRIPRFKISSYSDTEEMALDLSKKSSSCPDLIVDMPACLPFMKSDELNISESVSTIDRVIEDVIENKCMEVLSEKLEKKFNSVDDIIQQVIDNYPKTQSEEKGNEIKTTVDETIDFVINSLMQNKQEFLTKQIKFISKSVNNIKSNKPTRKIGSFRKYTHRDTSKLTQKDPSKSKLKTLSKINKRVSESKLASNKEAEDFHKTDLNNSENITAFISTSKEDVTETCFNDAFIKTVDNIAPKTANGERCKKLGQAKCNIPKKTKTKKALEKSIAENIRSTYPETLLIETDLDNLLNVKEVTGLVDSQSNLINQDTKGCIKLKNFQNEDESLFLENKPLPTLKTPVPPTDSEDELPLAALAKQKNCLIIDEVVAACPENNSKKVELIQRKEKGTSTPGNKGRSRKKKIGEECKKSSGPNIGNSRLSVKTNKILKDNKIIKDNSEINEHLSNTEMHDLKNISGGKTENLSPETSCPKTDNISIIGEYSETDQVKEVLISEDIPLSELFGNQNFQSVNDSDIKTSEILTIENHSDKKNNASMPAVQEQNVFPLIKKVAKNKLKLKKCITTRKIRKSREILTGIPKTETIEDKNKLCSTHLNSLSCEDKDTENIVNVITDTTKPETKSEIISLVENRIDIQIKINEDTDRIIANKQRTRRKSKSFKKIDKIENDLFKDFALVINKKTKRIPPTNIVDDTVCDEILCNISKPNGISLDSKNNCKTGIECVQDESIRENLDDSVEEMDMEIEEIPVSSNIIERGHSNYENTSASLESCNASLDITVDKVDTTESEVSERTLDGGINDNVSHPSHEYSRRSRRNRLAAKQLKELLDNEKSRITRSSTKVLNELNKSMEKEMDFSHSESFCMDKPKRQLRQRSKSVPSAKITINKNKNSLLETVSSEQLNELENVDFISDSSDINQQLLQMVENNSELENVHTLNSYNEAENSFCMKENVILEHSLPDPKINESIPIELSAEPKTKLNESIPLTLQSETDVIDHNKKLTVEDTDQTNSFSESAVLELSEDINLSKKNVVISLKVKKRRGRKSKQQMNISNTDAFLSASVTKTESKQISDNNKLNASQLKVKKRRGRKSKKEILNILGECGNRKIMKVTDEVDINSCIIAISEEESLNKNELDALPLVKKRRGRKSKQPINILNSVAAKAVEVNSLTGNISIKDNDCISTAVEKTINEVQQINLISQKDSLLYSLQSPIKDLQDKLEVDFEIPTKCETEREKRGDADYADTYSEPPATVVSKKEISGQIGTLFTVKKRRGRKSKLQKNMSESISNKGEESVSFTENRLIDINSHNIDLAHGTQKSNGQHSNSACQRECSLDLLNNDIKSLNARTELCKIPYSGEDNLENTDIKTNKIDSNELIKPLSAFPGKNNSKSNQLSSLDIANFGMYIFKESEEAQPLIEKNIKISTLHDVLGTITKNQIVNSENILPEIEPLTHIIKTSDMDIAPVIDEIDKSLEIDDIYDFTEELVQESKDKIKGKKLQKRKYESENLLEMSEPGLLNEESEISESTGTKVNIADEHIDIIDSLKSLSERDKDIVKGVSHNKNNFNKSSDTTTKRNSHRTAKVKALENIHDEALTELTENQRNCVTIASERENSYLDVDDCNKQNLCKKPRTKKNQKQNDRQDLNSPSGIKKTVETVLDADGKPEQTKENIVNFQDILPNEEKNSLLPANEENSVELRRSRRGSRKVPSYNENDLIDPLIDALENRRKSIKKDKLPDKSMESKSNQTDKNEFHKDIISQGVQKKLNNDELFDLLKASSAENIYIPKPQNSFLNNLEESNSSRDFNDENFDNVFENILEKSSLLIQNNQLDKKKDVDKIYEFTESSSDNIDQINFKNKKFSKSRQKPQAEEGTNTTGTNSTCNMSLENVLSGTSTIDMENNTKNVSRDNKNDSCEGLEKSNYCEICNKSFIRIENLIKHKVTLTHISKLSEIEAKEAEKKARSGKQDVSNSAEIVTDISESSLKTSDSLRNEINITDILQQSEKPQMQPLKVQTAFSNNESLKLADIINDVLNKPVLRNVDSDKPNNFSDIIMGNDNGHEFRRYKSLGERKSFDSDSNKPVVNNECTPVSDNYFQQTVSKTTILEKQISLLENIIENQTGALNNFIDDISLSSNNSATENNVVEDNSGESYTVEIIDDIRKADAHNDSFVKPAQYEEISDDSINQRSYDDQKLRKTLNRDEELFLECCSLLKSGSEVSNYSKNSKALNNIDLKKTSECDWLNGKILTQTPEEAQEFSDNSRTPTPLGDTYDDNASNSNTISSNWNMKTGVNSEQCDRKSFTFEEVLNGDINDEEDKLLKDDISDFGKMLSNAVKNHFTSISEVISREIENEKALTSFNNEEKKESTDCSISDSRMIITKGARKVYEGLKVSIPTEELNLEKVLNCSPISKKLEVLSNNNSDIIEENKNCVEESVLSPKPPRSTRKSRPVKKSHVGSNLLFKINKKKTLSSIETDKQDHDVYDFEETQDTTEIFTKPNFRSFRYTKISSNKDVESDNESQGYTDSIGAEGQSISSVSSISVNFTNKQSPPENITKKKCMIMGRIFKNAAKSKVDEIDEEIRTIPEIDNNELVENFVLTCTQQVKNTQEELKRSKLSEKELDVLFDQLLQRKPKEIKADNKFSTKARGDTKNGEIKKKAKFKGRKRNRGHSESSDDEFNINKATKKRSYRKNAKEEDNCINLEQELRECIGVASRKSQRKCTSGKQNILVEYWSSDEEAFEALLESQKIETKKEDKVIVQLLADPNISTDIKEEKSECPAEVTSVMKTSQKKKAVGEKKQLDDANKAAPTIASNRRKRAAANPLYHWSSSSEDESQNLIEVKPIRDELEEEDRPVQHGWIVGDSPKKLVTMLALTKGKKTEIDCVKEQSKRRTNAVS